MKRNEEKGIVTKQLSTRIANDSHIIFLLLFQVLVDILHFL